MRSSFIHDGASFDTHYYAATNLQTQVKGKSMHSLKPGISQTIIRFLAFTPLLLLAAPNARASFPIANGGKPLCVIVGQPDATAPEIHAVDELAATLKQITGATFAVREGKPQAGERAIVVGPDAQDPALVSAAASDRASNEAVTMRTIGDTLLLSGGRPRGTLYAVYHFLEDQCGVRWWTAWATDIPHRPTLTVPDLNVTEKPASEYREPFWFPAFDGDWAVRHSYNGKAANLTPEQGGKVTYKGFVHTFYDLVPPDKYFKTHPEWYSLINGKRTFAGAQLCTTNPQLRDFIVERVREWLHEQPDANIVSISQNDQFGACECPVCKAVDDAEGSHSGTMLALVNYVAEKIEKDYPNVAIDTLAYQYTRHPPKTIKPRANVIVRLCSIECNFAAPLSDPSNASFGDDLRAWSKICNRLYVWDYTTDFGHYVMPFPNWFVLGPNLRFLQENHVKGVFEEGAYQSNGSEMAELRSWVLARLLWNPQQDDRALINEFLDGYYGRAAAPFIRQYLDLIHTAAARYYMGIGAPANAPFLELPVLTKAEQLWNAAETAAQNDPEKLWRVRQGHLPVLYVWLDRWSQLRRTALRSGALWPLPTSRQAVATDWLSTATGPGPAGWTRMTHLDESGLTPEAFIGRFAIDPPEPVIKPGQSFKALPPSDIPGLQPGTGVDVQDDAATLYREGELSDLRPDVTASDGWAAWMPGSHHEWAFQ
ncbi:MAG: DUF4838 domain-containing protein, partial [Armatimonadota bacterium]|nr:DUF4838 domain-containing protein [Armatimonadota bacterium]